MGVRRLIPPLTAAIVAVLMLGQAAHADLLIQIDKSAHAMMCINRSAVLIQLRLLSPALHRAYWQH
jgi:hypothetical protein